MVTADQIEVSLGRPLTLAERDQAQMWIDGAALIIGQRFALSSLDPAALDFVITEAVTLRFRNPDGVLQRDVQIDDGRVSRRFSHSTGQITILPEWWALLAPSLGDDGAFSFGPA